jgi:cell division protein FtsQ
MTDDKTAAGETSGDELFLRQHPAYEAAPVKKKKKRKKKRYLLKFCIFCLLCTGTYYFLTSEYLNVTEIEVIGNEYYTEAQVIQMTGIQTGKNMFEFKSDHVRDVLLADPYFKNVKIRRIPMGTVRVTVTERMEYAAVPYGESFVLLDNEGTVLRVTEESPTLPLLVGMTLVEMTPGEALAVEEAYLLTDTLELLQIVEQHEVYFKKIDFSTVIVKAYIYDTLYCEGAPGNIRDNMESVEKLLFELYQQDITHGVVKVGKDNYLSFSSVIE